MKNGQIGDNQIISLLFDRDQRGLEEIRNKYSRLYGGILRGILEDPQDADECENDLLLALWDSIPPNSPENLMAYICRIARNLGIDRQRANRRKKRGGESGITAELDDSVPDTLSPSFEDEERSAAIRAVVDKFLLELDPTTRVLFLRRYYFFESCEQLAERFRMKRGTVSSKLHRARNQLKNALKKEGINL